MIKEQKLNALLKDKNLDGILISNPSNIFYFSKFTGTSAKLLICEDAKYIITDFRYIQQATETCIGYDVVSTDADNDIYSVINKLRKKHKLHTLGLEGDTISRNEWLAYERKLTSRLSDINIDSIREIKTDDEIALIKHSISIAEEAFNLLLKEIKVGVSEKHLARFLEFKMLELGAEKIAFDTIVASGKRGALPHGVASDKLIANNELITFDFGCIYKGYCSDLTRTVGIGEISDELRDIYNTVLEANLLGIKSLEPNIDGFEVDKIVRDFIDSTQYKGLFGHGLGHSFGVEVHENPRLRNDGSFTLHSGSIVTIEPGIYVDGVGGVRIEDDVLITDTGIEILSSLSKELIIL